MSAGQMSWVLLLAVLTFSTLVMQNMLGHHVASGRLVKAVGVGIALFAIVLLSTVVNQLLNAKPAEVARRPARTAAPRPRTPAQPKHAVARYVPARAPAVARTFAPAPRTVVVYLPAAPPAHRTPAPRRHTASIAAPATSDRAAQLAALAAARPDTPPEPCVTSARIVVNAVPAIPPEISAVVARTARATIRVELDAQGDVTSTSVLTASGSASLDQAARDAAAKSRYEPARSACVPIRSHLDLTETFAR